MTAKQELARTIAEQMYQEKLLPFDVQVAAIIAAIMSVLPDAQPAVAVDALAHDLAAKLRAQVLPLDELPQYLTGWINAHLAQQPDHAQALRNALADAAAIAHDVYGEGGDFRDCEDPHCERFAKVWRGEKEEPQ